MGTDNWGRLLKISFWKSVIQWSLEHRELAALLAALTFALILIFFGG